MEIENKINKLGKHFRGLWISNIAYDYKENNIELKECWAVTFTFNGEYVDTGYQDSPEEALDVALIILNKLKDTNANNQVKPVILDNNPLSIASYMEEHPEHAEDIMNVEVDNSVHEKVVQNGVLKDHPCECGSIPHEEWCGVVDKSDLCECGHLLDTHFKGEKCLIMTDKKNKIFCKCNKFKLVDKSATDEVEEMRKRIDRDPKFRKEVEKYEKMAKEFTNVDKEPISKAIDDYYKKYPDGGKLKEFIKRAREEFGVVDKSAPKEEVYNRDFCGDGK